MLDWRQLEQSLEHALTLDRESAARFVAEVIPDGEALTAANRLLGSLYPPKGFMNTRAGGDRQHQQTLDEGARLGPWQVQSLIGKGGMGEVYRATRADGLYDQAVAIKLMHGTDDHHTALVTAERQRLALMEHPGIARIVDGGTTDGGRPYIVMELVDGLPLDQFAIEQNLSRRQRLELAVQVCAAVSHAHSKLILHRDIKVANVMVDSEHQPRLIDFGIAATLADDALRGGPLTLYCAAPEQLMGKTLSAQTDVFALGVLIHELLTQQKPDRQQDGGVRLAVHDALDAELRAIVNRAVATDPAARYDSVSSLADDLRAYLAQRPVNAYDGGVWYRLGKLVRRAPVASALAGALVVALTVGLATSMKFASDAQAEANRANLALQRAQWQWNRTEASLAAQQAYSEILQTAFGGQDNAERLSETLYTRWQSAWQDRENDPDSAASISYAVGRNFYFRGDTRRALEVFDPWMQAPIGPQPLIDIGKEVYALMLSTAGRYDEAEPRLRELVSLFETGFQESEADLFNYAFQLAKITKASADLERAENLVLGLIENDTEPFERLFHHNQLGFLRLARDDMAGAHAAYQTTVDIFDENPQLAVYGRDIARLNLASQELNFNRDPERAEAIVSTIMSEDVPLKGESAQVARTLMLLGLIASERGELGRALATLDEAAALFEQYAGARSRMHLKCLAASGGVLADHGDTVAARQRLEEVRSLAVSEGYEATDLTWLTVLELFLASTTGDRNEDLKQIFGEMNLAPAVRGDAFSRYWFQRMVESGALPASLLAPS